MEAFERAQLQPKLIELILDMQEEYAQWVPLAKLGGVVKGLEGHIHYDGVVDHHRGTAALTGLDLGVRGFDGACGTRSQKQKLHSNISFTGLYLHYSTRSDGGQGIKRNLRKNQYLMREKEDRASTQDARQRKMDFIKNKIRKNIYKI